MLPKRIALLLLSATVALWAVQPPEAAEPAGRDQPVADGAYRLAMPNENWALELDLSSFDVQGEQMRSDGLGKMMRAQDPKGGVIVSVFLEKEPQLETSEECRAFYWAKDKASRIPKSDIRLSARGDLTLVEWTVKEFMGQQVNQRNLQAFLAHSGYCVDMHLSKTDFKPEDQSLFDEFLARARIVGESQ